VFPGFYVDSLDRVTEALTQVGSTVLTSHQEMPWGCRIVAEDPDGRAIEINQQGHCPGS
jgi:predicted enzyme related to lactoylglutathione lyase